MDSPEFKMYCDLWVFHATERSPYEDYKDVEQGIIAHCIELGINPDYIFETLAMEASARYSK